MAKIFRNIPHSPLVSDIPPYLPVWDIHDFSDKPYTEQEMTDPISVTITLATFVKDLIDLGQSIKRSIEKVGENRRRIQNLTENILYTLANLAHLLNGRETNFRAPQLLSALGDLKANMLHVLSVVQTVAPVDEDPHSAG
ncbi:hypothetical protein DFH07DRAFT_1059030 [Mycena maculata]|uniref:Uncharacterized protein n=1 Tax=Mycena maculata TaxID=230809 RepID=A0AAD7JIF8_9AGAR|nr:hypothetical protein DFH07DRAFT_1059030 [Mycena maculata]